MVMVKGMHGIGRLFILIVRSPSISYPRMCLRCEQVIDDEEVARRMWASKQAGAENYYMVEMNGYVCHTVEAECMLRRAPAATPPFYFSLLLSAETTHLTATHTCTAPPYYYSATVDARDYGNEARFVNHACEPNCSLQKWLVS